LFRSLQELLTHQEGLLRKTRKVSIFYDFSTILSEISKEDCFTRSDKLSQNLSSSMRLPLSSRSSFQIKSFKILIERQKHDLKSFATYSTIIAKNIAQRFLPNQNYIEKRNQRKVKPEAKKEKTLKKPTFKEDFESSLSMESNIGKSQLGKQKNKTVYFGSPTNRFSHQNSAISQTGKSGGLRKSLFARKREIKSNIFTDCYGNEHGFEEMKKVINKLIENKKEVEEFQSYEEYLKIRVCHLILSTHTTPPPPPPHNFY